MAIFGHRTPRLLTPRVRIEAQRIEDDWQRAAGDLEHARVVSFPFDKFERFLAEHARRHAGALRLVQSRSHLPVVLIAPVYQLVTCDGCSGHMPLPLMREVIQFEDTTLTRPARIWYACSRGCAEFLQRTLRMSAEHEEAAYNSRARKTLPLIDRGRA